jgi:hypothetical protein
MAYLFPEAKDAREAIRTAMIGGGTAQVEFAGETRMLLHDPVLHRAPATLPWPLNRLQPHQVSLTVFRGSGQIAENTFQRGEIDSAITLFLKDVPLTKNILITFDEGSQ